MQKKKKIGTRGAIDQRLEKTEYKKVKRKG